MTPESIRQHLQNHDFSGLFRSLGWDNASGSFTLGVRGEDYHLSLFAAKGGFQIFTCYFPNLAQSDRRLLLEIDRATARVSAEHLLIFHDDTHQTWMIARKRPGGPALPDPLGPFPKNHDFARLSAFCRGIHFTLEQEIKALEFGGFGIVEVAARVQVQALAERATKRFYDGFKRLYDDFLGEIEGLSAPLKPEWASLTLTRLMFLYFIQRKEFLLGERDYLRARFENKTARLDGKTDFLGGFLTPFFFEVLAQKRDLRSPKNKERQTQIFTVFGDVIYLNGGLFSPRDWERGARVQVSDAFFKRIFDLFDGFEWTLDERPTRSDKEINPDVLGYIFEKFINQKQMGAYYTKEDITGYIAKNTILPFLWEKAEMDTARGLELIQNDPMRYLYPAAKKGVELGLPPEIEAGIANVSLRTRWNEKADSKFANPTETWREVIARRERVAALTRRGEPCVRPQEPCVRPQEPCVRPQEPCVRPQPDGVGANDGAQGRTPYRPLTQLSDLLSHNLDIELWFADALADNDDPKALERLWHALDSLSILDPTVGSGAFLFAAMNVLAPVYDAVLAGMRRWVDEADAQAQRTGLRGARSHPLFRAVLDEVAAAPNRDYAIFKRMVVNNLYGVELMPEAAEVCKLRLFLKLAAQLQADTALPNRGIQPLPDIDFNIRAGNSLVGFATLEEAQNSTISQTMLGIEWSEVQEAIEAYRAGFALYHAGQQKDGTLSAQSKRELQKLHDAMSQKLDVLLAGLYGQSPKSNPTQFEAWKATHHPFHWAAEFHDIFQNGGFDVIIGNPPYVATSKVRKFYTVKGFDTERASDIYAWVLERVSKLANEKAWTGMIVPLSLSFSGDFQRCRKMLCDSYGANWFSSFARIPAALFGGDVRVRNVIHLGARAGNGTHHTTRLHRWFEEFRPCLMQSLQYSEFQPKAWNGLIPKTNTPALTRAFETLSAKPLTLEASLSRSATQFPLHFKKSAYNWLCFCRELPPCYDGDGNAIAHTEFGAIYFESEALQKAALLFLNGKIQFAYWVIVGDDFHVAKWMFADFPFNLKTLSPSQLAELAPLADQLEHEMRRNTNFKLNAGKRVGNYNLAKCRPVTDKSDALFAKHLGLSEIWPDIESLYDQIVLTTFDTDED